MSDDAQPRAGHPPLGVLAGMAAMFVAGAVAALLLARFAVRTRFDAEIGLREALASFTLITAVIAIPLFVVGGRYGRSFAIGVALACVAAWPWAKELAGDGSMSGDEIAREMATIQAAGAPAYYLGDEADGNDLKWVDADRGGVVGAATGSSFVYGSHCDYEGFCRTNVYVETFTGGRPKLHPDYLGFDGCGRLERVLGVPAATRGEWLLLFTGEFVIALTDSDDEDHTGERELAANLRQVGESTPPKVLPSPSPNLLAWVEDWCKATEPGVAE